MAEFQARLEGDPNLPMPEDLVADFEAQWPAMYGADADTFPEFDTADTAAMLPAKALEKAAEILEAISTWQIWRLRLEVAGRHHRRLLKVREALAAKAG